MLHYIIYDITNPVWWVIAIPLWLILLGAFRYRSVKRWRGR